MTVWFVGLLTASAPAKMRRNILFLAKRNFSRCRTLPATGSSGPKPCLQYCAQSDPVRLPCSLFILFISARVDF